MNSVLCWDCNIIIFLFTVQKCGPIKLAECAQWKKLRCCKTNFYAKITSCRQPASFPLLLSGNTLRSYTNTTETAWSVCCSSWRTPTWPVTQCAMKVSLAAQVMSHTVAAGIYTLVSYGKEQCLHSFCLYKEKVPYSNVTWYLILNKFFKLANFDIETSVELLMCLCFL